MTYLSVSQLAEMLKCSRQNVIKKIKRGTLKYPTKKVGNIWIIEFKKTNR